MFSLARAAVLVLALPALAAAQGFPKGPVKLIMREEVAKWARVIRAAHVTGD